MSNLASFDEVISFAKRRGFVFQTSEIYGGLANSYDFGPNGAELMRSIRNLWWREFITKRADMVGIDSQIMLHPQTWVASGHVGSFSDPLVEDKITHKRYRADHLIEAWIEKSKIKDQKLAMEEIVVENMTIAEMEMFIKEHKITSPDGNPLTAPKAFNLLFETSIGSVSGEKSTVYLRGETAQGIFSNFKNILDSSRVQLPFGVGQIGKSFRNEITTGQFIFRTLEFEQAEIEYFFDPDESYWEELFKDLQASMWTFVTQTLGVNQDNLRWRQHTDKERSHYSKQTYDLEYKYPFGWKELWGIAYRTDYDLKQHAMHSGKKLEYRHPQTGKVFTPHVIEPAVGVNRLALMVLCDALTNIESRTVLKVKPTLAPYRVAVFPLLSNKPELVAKAQHVFTELLDSYAVVWDQRGNIGKRYLSQDEIGTPFCVTVDFDTLADDTVTVRFRDTAKQSRVHIGELKTFIDQHSR